MHPLMLCIHMEKERMLRLSFAAMALGVRVKAVKEEETGQTLGMLCGLDETVSVPAAKIGGEMLVFAFLPDDLLNRLLPALRADGLPPVRLKAVLTPVNRGWTCGQLYEELRGEAEAFAKGAKS